MSKSEFTPAELIVTLRALLDATQELERQHGRELCAIPESEQSSARNLVHYLALRRHDLRSAQLALAELGLSSLGRAEGHVLATLEAVLGVLDRLAGETARRDPSDALSMRDGAARLAANVNRLLGGGPGRGRTRVMVTLGSDAASGPQVARELIAAGMDVARINSAHDDPAAWRAMMSHVRTAAVEAGRECRVLFDLAGPKLRTVPMRRGNGILRFRPVRDEAGATIRPARLWITWVDVAPPGPVDAVIRVHRLAGIGEPLRVGPGDALLLDDVPGRRRRLRVVESGSSGILVEADRGARVEDGTVLWSEEGDVPERFEIHGTPEVEQPVGLSVGDSVRLERRLALGEPERRDAEGRVIWPGRIGCTLDEVFEAVRPGHRILFDDGKLGGKIVRADASGCEVLITSSRGGRVRLAGDKGINLPDTALPVRGLTEKDLSDLDFAAPLVDLVGLSFVRSADDVVQLHRALAARGADAVGVVLKIETREAFEQLPALLLAGLQRPPLGVMVARGDLGVELGFERLAEVQEEILWFAEAAHVPVIWATQVLEGMTKRGMPSRAEVTDAAMSGRAECVMLNKGPHAADAVRFLADVLLRMEDHFDKKTAQLRRLRVSETSGR